MDGFAYQFIAKVGWRRAGEIAVRLRIERGEGALAIVTLPRGGCCARV